MAVRICFGMPHVFFSCYSIVPGHNVWSYLDGYLIHKDKYESMKVIRNRSLCLYIVYMLIRDSVLPSLHIYLLSHSDSIETYRFGLESCGRNKERVTRPVTHGVNKDHTSFRPLHSETLRV